MALTTSDRATLKQSQTQLEKASSHANQAKVALCLTLASMGSGARNRPALEALRDDTCATIRRCDVLASRMHSLLVEEPR